VKIKVQNAYFSWEHLHKKQDKLDDVTEIWAAGPGFNSRQGE